MFAAAFNPPPGLRNAHIQSVLSSSGLRRMLVTRQARDLLQGEQELLLDGGDGIRLQGFLTRHSKPGKGLAVLLHGWEGSSRSNYILATGARLFDQGYDVFRLNFRDHGESHHLNRGIFHSCRLDEVVNAIADLQQTVKPESMRLAGFSLGGNFSLRVALRAPSAGISLSRVVAVCPVINPANVLTAMEEGVAFYERYFIKKWERSLRKKQKCFPDDYDYEEWYKLGNLRERTDFLATRYYDFGSLPAYLDGYAIDSGRLAPLEVPTTILTAADDPVVPVTDFDNLPDNPHLELLISAHGGHCGFLNNWKLESWAEHLISKRFANA